MIWLFLIGALLYATYVFTVVLLKLFLMLLYLWFTAIIWVVHGVTRLVARRPEAVLVERPLYGPPMA